MNQDQIIVQMVISIYLFAFLVEFLLGLGIAYFIICRISKKKNRPLTKAKKILGMLGLIMAGITFLGGIFMGISIHQMKKHSNNIISCPAPTTSSPAEALDYYGIMYDDVFVIVDVHNGEKTYIRTPYYVYDDSTLNYEEIAVYEDNNHSIAHFGVLDYELISVDGRFYAEENQVEELISILDPKLGFEFDSRPCTEDENQLFGLIKETMDYRSCEVEITERLDIALVSQEHVICRMRGFIGKTKEGKYYYFDQLFDLSYHAIDESLYEKLDQIFA